MPDWNWPEFAVLLVGLALSAGIGYWLRGRLSLPASPLGLTPEQARKLLRRLRAIAVTMANEVGGHTTIVQTLIKELESPPPKPGQAASAVANAMTQILEANRALLKNLADAQQKLSEQTRQLESYMNMARTDPLTHLANRRAFDEEVARRLAEWRRHGVPLCAAMLDLDRFKELNDQHGHSVGDRVLKGVAKVLADTVRGMDLISRYGGEEFAVILPGTTLDVGRIAVQRLCAAIGLTTFKIDGLELTITMSGGLAEAQTGEDATALVKRADAALYASKEAGRNCVHFHDGAACHKVPPASTHLEPKVYQC
jgi:diguanylate cyclase